MRVLRSKHFFWAIMALFILESTWIAVSAVYPMVFDENTHLGIIKLHTHTWSPVFLHQPTNAGFAGELTRNPSYLYHYLMSFPYRVLASLTSSSMAQIIGLRFINIGLFASSLVLFRRVLLKARASQAMTNVILLFFVLIPVVPLLAAQINYDNLIMPLAGLAFLLAMAVNERLSALGRRLPINLLLGLLTVCLFGSLVQIEFLPIFASVILWLSWCIWKWTKSNRLKFWPTLNTSWRENSLRNKLALAVPLIVAVTLFIQMYGVNLAVYHSLIPQCNQVISAQECSQNGSWERSHLAQIHKVRADNNPLSYSIGWTYRLAVSLFYTSSGGARKAYYLSINPLPTVFITALAGFGLGLVLALRYWRRILGLYPHVKLFLLAGGLYTVALWINNDRDYLHTGIKVGINGRYLLPIVPLCLFVLLLGYQQLLKGRSSLRLGVFAIAFLLFLQGGGALTYLVYSNSAWYWQKPAIVRLNRNIQHVVKPLVILKSPMPVISGLK